MKHPFLIGYELGSRTKQEHTRRELDALYGHLFSCGDIDRLEHGMLDGITGDDFRRNLVIQRRDGRLNPA